MTRSFSKFIETSKGINVCSNRLKENNLLTRKNVYIGADETVK